LTHDLAALQAYALHYVAARADAIRAKVKSVIAWAALGLAGGLAAAAGLIVAVYLALQGIAEILGLALGGRYWAGELITGFGVLILAGAGAAIGLRYWLNLSRRQAKEKYERRRTQERIALGRDVAQRAAP
jgi:hypothetical protein